MSSPRISVIAPYHGVEDYLEPFLRTVRAQTHTNFECILVDDGSLDGSAAIAHRVADQDRRFVVVTQPNQGLAAARNTGTAQADGDYLIFLDSDDLVAPRAFEQFVTSLESSRSDFAASHVWRLPLSRPVETSWAHREPFAERRQRTSIREIPLLMRDRMAWNKMWRRTFWEDRGYAWPRMRFEDFPITIRAHLEAAAVDTLPDPTYVWRERATSISGLSASLSSVRDRVAAAVMVLDTVDALATREVAELVHSHLVDVDLREVLGALGAAVEADGPAVEEQARILCQRVDAGLVRLARPQYQEAFRAARDDNSARLRELAVAESAPQRSTGTPSPTMARRGSAMARSGMTRLRHLSATHTRSGSLTDLRVSETWCSYRVRVPLNGRVSERAHVQAHVGAVRPTHVRTHTRSDGLVVQLDFDTLALATQGGYHQLVLDVTVGPVRWEVSVAARPEQQHGLHRAGYWLQAVTRGGRLGFERRRRVNLLEDARVQDARLVVRVSAADGSVLIERPWPQAPLSAPVVDHEARFELESLVADDPADNPVTDIASRRVLVSSGTGVEPTVLTARIMRTYAGGREVELRPGDDGTAYLVHRPTTPT